MGCGRSKHDVASGNTVKHRQNTGAAEAIPVIDIVTNSSVQQQKFESNKDIESDHNIVHVADVKDIIVNAELKDGEIEELGKEEDVVLGEHEAGRLISRDSPNHYFSSRKDEDAIEAIVGEQPCESPYHEPIKEGELKVIKKTDGAVEDKGVVDEEEKRAETENEILVKEAKVVTTIEAVVVSSIEDKKNLDGVEGHLSDSSPKDLKTG